MRQKQKVSEDQPGGPPARRGSRAAVVIALAWAVAFAPAGSTQAATRLPSCSEAVVLQTNRYMNAWFARTGVVVNGRTSSGAFLISQYITRTKLRYAVVGSRTRPQLISSKRFHELTAGVGNGEVVLTKTSCLEREEGGD